MSEQKSPSPHEGDNTPIDALIDEAVTLARRWMDTAASDRSTARERRTAERLGSLVADPAGLDLAVRFVDDVARPPDDHAAAAALTRLGQAGDGAGAFLGPLDRGMLWLGARAATAIPGVVVPAARARLRQLVGHLVADAGPGLGAHLAQIRSEGYALNVNLLGEAVLGEDEAASRLARTIALIERPDVDYVSIKVSSVVSQLSTWDLDHSRRRVVDRLLPLYRAARENSTFVNLDMEEYKDLALTIDVFTDLLGREEFLDLEAGIVLQAYLPDTLGALDRLTDFATERRGRGGAPIKVRIVKGANLAMEAVEAEMHGWALAPYEGKPAVDANYLRLVDHALRSPRTDAVRIGVASHNLFHVALAVLLGRSRGVSHGLDIEMLQGMAPGEARAVRDFIAEDRVESGPHAGRGGKIVLYTPVVEKGDFDVAISYLVRRLEENAASQNFLHAMFAGGHDSDELAVSPMDAQEAAFRSAATMAIPYTEAQISPNRRPRNVESSQDRARKPTFDNAVDTDPAVAESRSWAARLAGQDGGYVQVRSAPVTSTEEIDGTVEAARSAAAQWAKTLPCDRARALRAVAARLEAARGELVATMMHEAGKTVAEADPEVSEAIDFASYYALSAELLSAVPGARFSARGVTLVAPPWNFPVAIPVGGVLAALAAGSAVVAKPAPQTPRCFEVAVEAIHAGLRDAGLLGLENVQDLVRFSRVPDGDLGKHLVTHPGIDQVILTGSIETARMFAQWAPERPVFAETSGKNAIIVTPSADLDLAVADIVHSAFGHAGQKCSAASLLILVGSAGDPATATGERIRRQLVDAVRSIAVGSSTDLATRMGPLIEAASGKLERALTQLDDGETWLVEPKQLEGPPGFEGRLWSPGLKDAVAPGSFFHLTECFGPVLGIMRAKTLDEAIALANAVPFGLTGGIHSLDDAEIERWLDTIEVGNAYVNRHITGAIVRRQPFGGWKLSAVGPGAKAGGPNYVAELGDWADDGETVPDRTTDPQGWLAWAEADDVTWWDREFGMGHDPSGLRSEANILRYRPVDRFTVRCGSDAEPVELRRVLHAARTAAVTADVVPADVVSDEEFARQIRDGQISGRVRVVGHSAGLAEAAAGRVGDVTILDGPVLASGRREMLTVLREQAISRTTHRYGHVR